MGVEYYVACEEHKDCFELGKGAWSELRLDLREKHEFLDHVVERWRSSDPEDPPEEIRDIAFRLWGWCEERGWKVKLISDHSDDRIDSGELTISDSRYGLEPIKNDEDPEAAKGLLTTEVAERIVGVATKVLGDLLVEHPIDVVRISFSPRLYNALMDMKE